MLSHVRRERFLVITLPAVENKRSGVAEVAGIGSTRLRQEPRACHASRGLQNHRGGGCANECEHSKCHGPWQWHRRVKHEPGGNPKALQIAHLARAWARPADTSRRAMADTSRRASVATISSFAAETKQLLVNNQRQNKVKYTKQSAMC